ncbi:unnamed protein product [Ixodes persulcatus]
MGKNLAISRISKGVTTYLLAYAVKLQFAYVHIFCCFRMSIINDPGYLLIWADNIKVKAGSHSPDFLCFLRLRISHQNICVSNAACQTISLNWQPRLIWSTDVPADLSFRNGT